MNSWVQHVKQYALTHGMRYSCALSDPQCKASYHSKKATSKSQVDLHMIVEKAQAQLKKKKPKIKGGMIRIQPDKSFTQQLYDALPIDDKVIYNKYETPQNKSVFRNPMYPGVAGLIYKKALPFLNLPIEEKIQLIRDGGISSNEVKDVYRLVNRPIPDELRPFMPLHV
jgi:hypothetical protein